LATLSPEQLPVAEQLLRGGLPAVRKAVAEQNENATTQGRPTVNAETIDRIAEELLGRANLAHWKDRAGGALTAGKELRLGDLRAVVTSARTIIPDDEAKAQLKELRAALTVRVDALKVEWAAKLDKAVEEGNAAEALRLTARTPDSSSQLTSEMAAKVGSLASTTLTTDASPASWREVVMAAVDSPIRRLVKPTGIPDDDECRALALRSAGALPEFAKLLGMKVPPPPPLKSPRRPPTGRRSS
jgi:DNA-binding transcriptional ArsR family regulator